MDYQELQAIKDKYIKEIFVCAELNTDKTKPLIYLKAKESLGLAKDEICVFEDTYHAAKTAKDAGFYVVAIEDDAEEKNRQEIKNICDRYIKSFSELTI